MAEPNKTQARLEHMLEACLAIESFVSGLSYEQFESNQLVLSATIRQLEVIGEASRNLDPSFTKRYPDIPWRKLVGLRNVLIHEYFDVFYDKVWEVATQDVPELTKSLVQILQREFR
jgi:uncharacterized protein with HEPN domain